MLYILINSVDEMAESEDIQPTTINGFLRKSFVTYYKPPTTAGNDAFVNPFEETEEPPIDLNDTSNSTDNGADETGFQYKKFYVTRVVIIPCLVLMVIFSLIIVFIIMKQLRAIIKLYMSVIFYAFSIQYFAVMMVTLLVYDEVKLKLLYCQYYFKCDYRFHI